jgi:hypothetical protein
MTKLMNLSVDENVEEAFIFWSVYKMPLEKGHLSKHLHL